MDDKQWYQILGHPVQFTVAYTGFGDNSDKIIVMEPIFRLGKADQQLTGFFIAGDIKENCIPAGVIIWWRILEEKEYPLLLGYKHTGDRLSQLLKGEG